MPGPRYSLRRLLAAVAASAIACAYLALVLDRQARALGGMTLAILAVATVSAAALQGRGRAFSTGFASAGWAYYAASQARPDSLPTARLIRVAFERLIGLPTRLDPEQANAFIQQFVSFLIVGHLVLTMLAATLGGLLSLSVWVAIRRRIPTRSGVQTALR